MKAGVEYEIQIIDKNGANYMDFIVAVYVEDGTYHDDGYYVGVEI